MKNFTITTWKIESGKTIAISNMIKKFFSIDDAREFCKKNSSGSYLLAYSPIYK